MIRAVISSACHIISIILQCGDVDLMSLNLLYRFSERNLGEALANFPHGGPREEQKGRRSGGAGERLLDYDGVVEDGNANSQQKIIT